MLGEGLPLWSRFSQRSIALADRHDADPRLFADRHGPSMWASRPAVSFLLGACDRSVDQAPIDHSAARALPLRESSHLFHDP